MNIFYPSLLVFTLALVLVYSFVPRFTPLIMAILAAALLTLGVYHHYSLFRHEYQQATWSDSLRMYAPAIMIGATIMFILFGIFTFFSRGSVPVPNIPNVINVAVPPSPSQNLATNIIGTPLTAAVNAVTNAAANVSSGIVNTVQNAANAVTNTVTNVVGNVATNVANTIVGNTGNIGNAGVSGNTGANKKNNLFF
jgi:predicted PurR-regulated permease PerM